MSSTLRVQGITFCCLAAAVAISSVLLPPLPERVELVIISALILAVGVPHGALDTIFARQVYGLRSPGAWLVAALLYGVLAVSVVGLWWIAPVVFLSGFLLVSIAHFAGDLESGVSPFTRIIYAGAVIVLPCLRFEADVARQFGFLVGPSSGESLAAVLSVLAWPWLLCALGAAAVESRRDRLAAGRLRVAIDRVHRLLLCDAQRAPCDPDVSLREPGVGAIDDQCLRGTYAVGRDCRHRSLGVRRSQCTLARGDSISFRRIGGLDGAAHVARRARTALGMATWCGHRLMCEHWPGGVRSGRCMYVRRPGRLAATSSGCDGSRSSRPEYFRSQQTSRRIDEPCWHREE